MCINILAIKYPRLVKNETMKFFEKWRIIDLHMKKKIRKRIIRANNSLEIDLSSSSHKNSNFYLLYMSQTFRKERRDGEPSCCKKVFVVQTIDTRDESTTRQGPITRNSHRLESVAQRHLHGVMKKFLRRRIVRGNPDDFN